MLDQLYPRSRAMPMGIADLGVAEKLAARAVATATVEQVRAAVRQTGDLHWGSEEPATNAGKSILVNRPCPRRPVPPGRLSGSPGRPAWQSGSGS
jgi:hypothetical protein